MYIVLLWLLELLHISEHFVTNLFPTDVKATTWNGLVWYRGRTDRRRHWSSSPSSMSTSSPSFLKELFINQQLSCI